MPIELSTCAVRPFLVGLGRASSPLLVNIGFLIWGNINVCLLLVALMLSSVSLIFLSTCVGGLSFSVLVVGLREGVGLLWTGAGQCGS